jgi:hypothetical protein
VLKRRKEIYEAKLPETRKGGDRENQFQFTGGKERQSEMVSSFADDITTKTGFTAQAVCRLIQPAERTYD